MPHVHQECKSFLVPATGEQEAVRSGEVLICGLEVELHLRCPVEIFECLNELVAAHEDRSNIVEADTLLAQVLEVRENVERLMVVQHRLSVFANIQRIPSNLNGLRDLVEGSRKFVQLLGRLFEEEHDVFVRFVLSNFFQTFQQMNDLQSYLLRKSLQSNRSYHEENKRENTDDGGNNLEILSEQLVLEFAHLGVIIFKDDKLLELDIILGCLILVNQSQICDRQIVNTFLTVVFIVLEGQNTVLKIVVILNPGFHQSQSE